VNEHSRALHRFGLEPEVRDWSDHLAGEVWELRVRLHQLAVRLTYWCRPDGTIVLLTVFRKTRQHEHRQIDRAVRAQQVCAAGHGRSATQDLREAGVMAGSHTRWVRPETGPEDAERVAIREALAFGKAVYDRRVALGLDIAELAVRAGMSADDIECIEEGGTEPTVALLRRLAAALEADVRLTPGHDLGSVGFEAHAA
jgi:ribosome-binding protein aMBF1 (putative translation factor)